MNRRLPPNIYARQYKTRGGYKQNLYYVRFVDWKGVRRTFPVGEDFNQAKEERTRLKRLNYQRHDFDIDRGRVSPPPSQNLFHWVDKFLDVKSEKLSADRDRYSAAQLKRFFGDCHFSAIINSKMLEYRKSRANTDKVSDATINRELACLKSILRLAHNDGALPKMPVIPFEAEHNERIRTATDEEYQRILAHLPRDDADVCEIIREMGLRPKEVLAITPADLDFINQTISMQRIRTKHGRTRPLPLSSRAWEILNRRAQGKQLSSRLFEFARYRVYSAFRCVCEALDIKGLWLYDLRATFVTAKQREGWPEKIIMEFTGHRSRDVFQRYSRPTIEDLRAFIGKADKRPKSAEVDKKTAVTGKRANFTVIAGGKYRS